MLRAIGSLPTSGRNDAKGFFAKYDDERNLKQTVLTFLPPSYHQQSVVREHPYLLSDP